MTASKRFEVERDGDVLVIAFCEEVTGFADSALLHEFDELLATPTSGQPLSVIVDFQKMQYFGSSLLEALLYVWNRIHPAGGKMLLCNLSAVGREIVEVSKFDTIWPICKSRGEAKAALQG